MQLNQSPPVQGVTSFLNKIFNTNIPEPTPEDIDTIYEIVDTMQRSTPAGLQGSNDLLTTTSQVDTRDADIMQGSNDDNIKYKVTSTTLEHQGSNGNYVCYKLDIPLFIEVTKKLIPTSNIVLMEVLQCRDSDGSFAISHKLANALHLQLKDMIEAKKKICIEGSAFTTTLILIFLKRGIIGSRNKWKNIANRANKYLSNYYIDYTPIRYTVHSLEQ